MSDRIEASRQAAQSTEVHLEEAYKPLGMSVLSAAASLKKEKKAKPVFDYDAWQDPN